MEKKPVVFNLPERTIDMIGKYCSENHIKPAAFVGDTILEYSSNREKLAEAVSRKIITASPVEPTKINKMSHRVPAESCSMLRELAKSCYLTFDGLTRIMFDDKLNKLMHQ